KEAHIIRRFGRSLGYGFVVFEDEAHAQEAIKTMDKQTLQEREINVEPAKPKQEGGIRGRGGFRGRFRGRGGYRGSFRGRFRGRGRGGFRGRGRGRGRGASVIIFNLLAL
ncbi:hypothetical protein BKA69DRAFT_1102153, partial [Paraphysoderma sedebokerense]